MFRNYMKIAWRNLLKDRQFTLLNLIGLATGLACSLLIYLWVNDELHVDKFHEKDERLYQVSERRKQDNNIVINDKTAGLVAETLKETMPEVEYAVPVMHYSWFPKFTLSPEASNNKIKAVGQFVGKDFFNVFSYGLIDGDKNQVLANKNSIVLSEEQAKKLFNTTHNLLGKVVEWQLGPFSKPVVISGIFKGTPPNSSEQFDFLLSFEDVKEINPSVLDWGNDGTTTYITLQKGASVDQFNNKIEGFLKSRLDGTNRSIFLRQYSKNYLYGKYENGETAGGRIQYVIIFSIIAIFILVIACINFMNLSTARASKRLKEVGVKKAAGASRASLIMQYLGESVLMTFLSLLLAVILVLLLLPQFNAITGKQLAFQLNFNVILFVLGIAFLTGIIAGSYPALYLSGFNAVAVLKGKLKTSLGELWVRKGLVVFQFALSVVFIISVIVIYRQINLIQTINLGYTRDNIIYFENEGIQDRLDAFISEIKVIPGVVNASGIDRRFTGSYNTTRAVDWVGKNPNQSADFEVVRVNYGLIELLGIDMKEGRPFSKQFGSDSSRVIFNDAAVQLMGLKDPIGKHVRVWDQDMEIIGVTKDFHFESLHETVKPLFMVLQPENSYYIMAKIRAGQEREVIGKMENVYERFNPGFSFDFKFLDEDYQQLYQSEQRVGVLSRYFAGIAIIVSCLGLFGLVAFTAQRRQKEIGIRKVVGASTGNVVFMLAKDFLKLVVVAIIVAFPLAWWMMSKWLNDFAYRIKIDASIFVIAALVTIILTILIISAQSIKAALANPAITLRSE